MGNRQIPLSRVHFYQLQTVYDRTRGIQHYFSVNILTSLNAIDPDSKLFHRLLLGAISVNPASRPGGLFVDWAARRKAIELTLEAVKDKAD